MAIVPVDTGTTANDGTGDDLKVAFEKVNTGLLELETGLALVDTSAYLESVSGGTGFVNVSGDVTLDLATGRSFHHTMTGNIPSLAFSNVPDANAFSTSWTWVLRVAPDAPVDGYMLSSTPTVTWEDGATWSDLNLNANAMNQVMFWTVGAGVHAVLISNGSLSLDPFVLSFATNGAQLVVIARAETLDLAGVTNLEADGTAGTGTLTYKKNNGANLALAATAFAAGDVLTVTMASSTTPSAVSIPRSV